jgi:hypothetical protein
MKTLILALMMASSSLCFAEVEIYKSTYNTGINKLEQITAIETYLTKLSSMVNSMEEKLDANSVKLTTLENMLKSFKEVDLKKVQDQLGEQRAKAATPEMAELQKLKADVTAIKNEDIEKIRIQIQGLNSTIQSMQLILNTTR